MSDASPGTVDVGSTPGHRRDSACPLCQGERPAGALICHACWAAGREERERLAGAGVPAEVWLGTALTRAGAGTGAE